MNTIYGSAVGANVIYGKNNTGVAFGGVAAPTFSPTDISDLYVWYDATDSDTITESGNRVSKWENKESTTARDLIQATADDKPLYVASGSSDSGNAVIDTTDDRFMVTASALSAITQPISIVAITKFPPNGGGIIAQYLFGKDPSESEPRFIFSKNTQDADDRFTMFAGVDFIENVSGFANEWNYITLLYNGTSSSMRFNGTEIDTGNAGTEDFVGLVLGARGSISPPDYAWNNEIMHFLIYNKLLSSDDIENIETWAETQMNG